MTWSDDSFRVLCYLHMNDVWNDCVFVGAVRKSTRWRWWSRREKRSQWQQSIVVGIETQYGVMTAHLVRTALLSAGSPADPHQSPAAHTKPWSPFRSESPNSSLLKGETFQHIVKISRKPTIGQICWLCFLLTSYFHLLLQACQLPREPLQCVSSCRGQRDAVQKPFG